MALIKCSDCGNMVSEIARFCPNCGNPEIEEEHIEEASMLEIIIKVLALAIPIILMSLYLLNIFNI